MKKNLKKLAYSFSKPFPIKTIINWTNQNFIFPFYHLASDNPPTYVKHLFPVSTITQFKKDLDFLLQNYSPAAFSDVLDYIKNGKKSPKPKFFLSFDDGFSECHDIIAPILKQKGIPAAFFINPAFVDNKQLSHRQKVSLILEELPKPINSNKTEFITNILGYNQSEKYSLCDGIKRLGFKDEKRIHAIAGVLKIDFEKVLTEAKPYMSSEEIKNLEKDGFTFGSHSYNHAEFFDLDDNERINQLDKSFDLLHSEFNIAKRYFSFPFTDDGVSASFFEYLSWNSKIDVSFGTAGLKNDTVPNHIQRIPIETYGFPSAESIIRAEYFYYLGKAIFKKNTIKRP